MFAAVFTTLAEGSLASWLNNKVDAQHQSNEESLEQWFRPILPWSELLQSSEIDESVKSEPINRVTHFRVPSKL